MMMFAFVIYLLFYLGHLYYFYFQLLWPVAEQISRRCLQNFSCARHWIWQEIGFGKKWKYRVDLADSQWRQFRDNLALLGLVAIGSVFVNAVVYRLLTERACTQSVISSNISSSALNIPRLVIAIAALFVQHGLHALVSLALSLIGFGLVHAFAKSKFCIHILWGFCIFLLLFKECYRLRVLSGYDFLLMLFPMRNGGMYPWHFPANFMSLRIISYALDYHWRLTDPAKILKQHSSLPVADYNLINYLSYVFYAPLYIGGPIVTFDQFILNTRSPQRTENTVVYGLRWTLCFCLMEILTSRFPFFAVSRMGLLHLDVHEIAVVFYLLLKMMWLKFLLIWRFFRWWALCDGIVPPENMLRCMSNNYRLEQFWRGWHASYNQWLIRYLYVPLGGKALQHYSIWLIFGFVALWHDMELKLLLWGLLNAGFFVLEKLIFRVLPLTDVPKRHWLDWQPLSSSNVLSSLVGALYIEVLMGVNLIGYGIGTGGIAVLAKKLWSYDGLSVMLGSLYFLMVGVNIMRFLEHMQKNYWQQIDNAKSL